MCNNANYRLLAAASTNGTKMRSSLLGMAFLKRMKSFEMKGQKLYLRWR